jgi:uncharacterized protein (TIGR02246 family)
MRNALAVIALVLSACSRPQPQPATFTDADRTANRQVVEKFTKGVLASDFASVAALYTPDGTMMPPNEPTLRGRDAIQKWMAGFPKIATFQATDDEIEGSGDIAYVAGRYKMSFTPPGAKAPVTDSGKFVEVRKKQPDGSWLILRDIFNSDVPLPAPAGK